MFRKLPIYSLLNSLIKSQCSWHVKILFLIILIVAINIASIFFSKSATLRAMRAFHLSSNNYGWWTLEQVSPRMYTFANYSTNTTRDTTSSKFQINHYPTRIMTFNNRRRVLKDQATYNLNSEYRGTRLESVFFVDQTDVNKFSLIKIKQHEHNEYGEK